MPEPRREPAAAPADIEVRIAWDGMSASLSRVGKNVPFPDILKALKAKGIRSGIDEEGIRALFQQAQEKGWTLPAVVAKGLAPIPGADSKLETLLKHGDVVVPGTVIGTWHPATPGTPGMQVAGARIPPEPGKDRKLLPGTQVIFNKTTGTLASRAYGTLQLEGFRIDVAPAVSVTADKMRATANLHGETADGTPVTGEILRESLRQLGVVSGLHEELLDSSLEQARAEKKPRLQVVVAEGLPAVAGKRQEYRLLVPENTLVFPGEPLAPTEAVLKGTPGKDLAGKPVPPPEVTRPETEKFAAGNGVEISRDRLHLVASWYGRLRISGGKLAVEIPVALAKHDMEATLELGYREGRESQLTREVMLAALKARGVVAGIQAASLDQALEKVAREKPARLQVVVARGQPVENGSDSRLEFLFPEGGVVFPGQGVGKYLPATRGQEGRNVLGKRLPPESGKVHHFRTGRYLELKEKEGSIKSLVYGRLQRAGLLPDVQPLIQVSPDQMAATAELYGAGADGSPVTPEAVRAGLKQLGVVYGIKEEAIRAGLQEARTTGKPVKVVAAEGTPAREGRREEYRLLLPEGSVVLPGEILAPTEGMRRVTPGKDLAGKVLLPPEVALGEAEKFTAGPGVETAKDRQHLVASQYGRFVPRERRLTVEPPVEVPKEGMEAFIDLLYREDRGTQVGMEMVLAALRTTGVVAGIQTQELEQALGKLGQERKSVLKVKAAQGKAPVAGTDSRLEYLYPEGAVTGPGMVVGRYQQATAGTAGENVQGRPVPPASGKETRPRLGRFLELKEREGTIRSQMYGTLALGTLPEVRPLFRLERVAGGTEAGPFSPTVDLHPKDAAGNEITLAQLKGALTVCQWEGSADWAGVEKALQEAQTAGTPRTGVKLAREEAPEEGDPGKKAAGGAGGARQGSAPAVVEVAIARDQMSASLVKADKEATLGDLQQALRAKGVKQGIDEAALSRVLEELKEKGRLAAPVPVAKGIPVVPGTDTGISDLLADGAVVLPGSVVAVITSATKGTPGRTVTGQPLPPTPGKEKSLRLGSLLAYLRATGKLISKSYGKFSAEKNSFDVHPLIVISPDRMKVTAALHAQAADGQEMTLELLVSLLKPLGVRYGVKEQEIIAALERSRQERQPVRDLVLAEALPAQPGKLSDYRLLLPEKEPVLPGDKLAPTEAILKGVPGRDLSGKPVFPEPPVLPETDKFVPGPGIALSRDRQHLEAVAYGILTVNQRRLSLDAPTEIAKDKMEAFIDLRWRPDRPTDLTREIVVAALKAKGIVSGILSLELDQALEKMRRESQSQCKVKAARGKIPVAGTDARMEYLYPEGAVVTPGLAIGRYTPATEGDPGETVTGQEIPQKPGAAPRLKPGRFVEFKERQRLLVAQVYGKLRLAPEGAEIVPLLAQKEGNVLAELHPRDAAGNKITLALLKSSAVKLNLAGACHWPHVEKLLVEILASGQPQRDLSLSSPPASEARTAPSPPPPPPSPPHPPPSPPPPPPSPPPPPPSPPPPPPSPHLHPGEISPATGHLLAEGGDLRIDGGVQDGMEVRTPGNLDILGACGDAILRAGGQIVIGAGITQGGRGSVAARGNITATLADHAVLRAGGEILLRDHARHATLRARGKIQVRTGQGRIAGGTTRSATGLAVKILGNEAGDHTLVILAREGEDPQEWQTRRDAVARDLARLETALGNRTWDQAALSALDPTRRPAMEELLRRRVLLEAERDFLGEEPLRHPSSPPLGDASLVARVYERIFPGVSFVIAGQRLEIQKVLGPSVVSYDATRNTVLVTPV